MDDIEDKKICPRKEEYLQQMSRYLFQTGRQFSLDTGEGGRGWMEQLQNKMNCRVLPLNGVLNEVVDQR